MIGMDSEAVNKKFAKFLSDYPSLDSRQTQFIRMLTRQIKDCGPLEIDRLYEMPFAAVGEFDSLFDSEQQINDLIAVIKSFGDMPSKIPEQSQ